jgi:DNA polymerase-1
MPTTILLDGDINVYAAACACETAVCVDEMFGLWSWQVSMPKAIAHLEDGITKIKERHKTDKVIVALSDPADNWRYNVLLDYKDNRKSVKKPIAVKELRKYIKANYKCMMAPGLEGDDVLGILATSDTLVTGPRIIISIDKDMKTIPSTIEMVKRHRKKTTITTVTISEEEADWWHMMQTITGDTTDGYKGCPGVGKVNAARIIDDAIKEGRRVWDAVVDAYEAAGLTEDDALMQARVARILRASDYDFVKKEVILWCPPNAKT